MSRSQPYRSKMPVQILRALDVASRITLFLVGQTGPLSFTFKDRLDNKYKTSIGPEVRCSCALSRNDHCIHTLYVMLKVFKVSTQNPILWQAAYVDSELTDLLAGKHTICNPRQIVRPIFEATQFSEELPSEFISRQKMKKIHVFPASKAERMAINEQSVCPICQEQLATDQCLSYCRVKCGNNFHTECLKVWAEHKKTTEALITCPMCRAPQGEDFLLELAQEEKKFKKQQSNKMRMKFKCSGCGIQEIPNNVHKCILCTSYELCHSCYTSGKHIKHPFMKQTDEDGSRWCGAEERREGELKIKDFIAGKRKEKNMNSVLTEKLRKVEEDPSKILDFVASSYPYVSKYISQNIDPYHKLDLEPEKMKCNKCQSSKMLFLRRLPCGHFCDHECLKENIRRGKFYCDDCGNKLLKGYENLVERTKKLQEQKDQLINISSEFNPRHMEADANPEGDYNFVLPEEATLHDILGPSIQERTSQYDSRRMRDRFASHKSGGTQYSTHQRKPSQETPNLRRESQREVGNGIRIRNVSNQQHRSVSRNPRRSREDMAHMLEAMIGRKVF